MFKALFHFEILKKILLSDSLYMCKYSPTTWNVKIRSIYKITS